MRRLFRATAYVGCLGGSSAKGGRDSPNVFSVGATASTTLYSPRIEVCECICSACVQNKRSRRSRGRVMMTVAGAVCGKLKWLGSIQIFHFLEKTGVEQQ